MNNKRLKKNKEPNLKFSLAAVIFLIILIIPGMIVAIKEIMNETTIIDVLVVTFLIVSLVALIWLARYITKEMKTKGK